MEKSIFLMGVLYLFLSACASVQPIVQPIVQPEETELNKAGFCSVAEYNRRPAADHQCVDLFNSKKEITDMMSLGQAMTEGMLLNPNQVDIFDVYRKFFFGYAEIDIGRNLKSVLDELQKHPELIKLHFPEYEISAVEKTYETPGLLANYLKSQIQTAADIRNNLFQIESNLGFWKKVLDYKDSAVPAELQAMQKKLGKDSLQSDKDAYRKLKSEFESRNKKNFETYLNRIISKTNRNLLAKLKDNNQEYTQKTLALFKTLKYLQEWLDKKGRNTLNIRQAMVDLVYTNGYGNQATQTLLKSKNGLEKVEGLEKILDEANSLSKDLGYSSTLDLQNKLKIDFPTGFTKNEVPQRNVQNLKQQVLLGKMTTRQTETVRVRSLSIQESPFRSCLGGDCASRTYFSKALDPNYNYFTMTDKDNHSSGHLTVVLGQAKNARTGKTEKVAFADKIQNISNNKMQMFLTAVSKSLAEKGYKLVLPDDVGDHDGLSNVDATRHFVAQEILPKLTAPLQTFTPTTHQYNFPSEYSRAYDKLDVQFFDPIIFEQKMQAQNIEITAGRKYSPQMADANLDKNRLIKDFLYLKSSAKEEDLLKYISSGAFVGQLERLGLYKTEQYKADLKQILDRENVSFQVKKQAVFEIMVVGDGSISDKDFSKFNDQEKTQMISEIRQWGKSNNERRKNFYNGLEAKWELTLQASDTATLGTLISLNLFNLNTKNESGFLPIIIAAHANQKAIVEWILNQPDVDFSSKDEFGLNMIEQLRLMGRNEMADLIQDRHPELKSAKIEVRERTNVKTLDYPMGMPIMGFVDIGPGKFRMGFQKISTTIPKAFQLMSTHTTQKQWKEIVELSQKYLAEEIKLNADPSRCKGEFNPVEQVSYNDIVIWTKALNEVSKSDDVHIQKNLNELFPGHKKGSVYRLPTEAEYEYVLRQRGLANSQYLHGDSEAGLDGYAVYNVNSGKKSQPVGQEKPLLINGKAVYGIVGNVWHWLSDWHDGQLTGGVNPQGPAAGSYRVVRGGSWNFDARGLSANYRNLSGHSSRYSDFGFRLVRTSP